MFARFYAGFASVAAAPKRLMSTSVKQLESHPYWPEPGTPDDKFFKMVHKGKPFLKFGQTQTGGRNNRGRITVRGRGGGVKQSYRILDTKRQFGVECTVARQTLFPTDAPKPSREVYSLRLDSERRPEVYSHRQEVIRVEYDPNRSGYIALLADKYLGATIGYHYILSPHGLRTGTFVNTYPRDMLKAPVGISTGDCLPLGAMPPGTEVHSIEIQPGRGAQIARSAGTSASIAATYTEAEQLKGRRPYVLLRLRSKQVIELDAECMGVVGVVSNIEHHNVKLGKAGTARRLGWRPKVGAHKMNACDHPMGGAGNGGIPKTPWGKLCKGPKTSRSKRRKHDKLKAKAAASA
eukprot:Colp12_sorted_trinity150504_noHs@28564